MERPAPHDPAIVEASVRKHLLKPIMQWLEDGSNDTDDEAGIIKELVETVRYRRDGYERAKHLDDWCPDANLVEILDAFSVYTEHIEAVKAWVVLTKPKPIFKIGDHVEHKPPYEKYPLRLFVVGMLDDIASYILGPEKGKPAGRIVPWESKDVTAAPWIIGGAKP